MIRKVRPHGIPSVRAVIFDWSGTMVDFGSRAPVEAFIETFKSFDVTVTVDQARMPMGMAKWDHIAALGHMPEIAAQWEKSQGSPMSDRDVDTVYEKFVGVQAEIVGKHSELIPGALKAANDVRMRGARLGSTTGYPKRVMEPVLRAAKEQGYDPEVTVCEDDVPAGRPAPFMLYKALLDLEATPAWACVAVDDTAVGIQAGNAAGMWTVGCLVSGNAMGLSLAEWEALSDKEKKRRKTAAKEQLKSCGAHYVVDTVDKLPQVLNAIDARLMRGERPFFVPECVGEAE